MLKDNSQDIIYGDFPYALGSNVYIDPLDNKPKFKVQKDFQNKWDMPNHEFWEEFFKEAFRVLKHGGRILAFGIDRQLMLFNYYAVAAGLETQQSLYWFFIQNFPKAVDLSKQIDKKLDIERDIDTCDLSKEYEGYKYSIAPLKQSLETIMVFQKPTKTNTLIDDFILFAHGDNTISPNIWNIDHNRKEAEDEEYYNNFRLGHIMDSSKTLNLNISNSTSLPNENGRYPSQLFCNTQAAAHLDQQSGNLKSGAMKKGTIRQNELGNTYNKMATYATLKEINASSGGCSKILHHIDYLDEEIELLTYCAKVNDFERYAGAKDNTHPTLKPIKLNKRIALLLKAPFPQNICFPFVGSGSEYIGFDQAGYDTSLFTASEINSKYVSIAEKRIKFWHNRDIEKVKQIRKEVKASIVNEKEPSLFEYIN